MTLHIKVVRSYSGSRYYTSTHVYAAGQLLLNFHPLNLIETRLSRLVYEKHWAEPSQTSIMWLGFLFPILSLTMLSYHQFKDSPPEYERIARALSDLYRQRTTQCLLIADITKYAPYTLETLIFSITAEHSFKGNAEAGIYIMIGILVRTALHILIWIHHTILSSPHLQANFAVAPDVSLCKWTLWLPSKQAYHP